MTTARQDPAPHLVQFRWHRLEGASWQIVRQDPQALMTIASPAEPWPSLIGREGEAYEPLKEQKALFRLFAALDDTKEAYLEFARRYGSLVAVTTARTTRLTGLPGGFAGGIAEWSMAREDLAIALGIWDHLHDGASSDVLHGGGWETRPVGQDLGVYRKRARSVSDRGSAWLDLVVPAGSSDREIVQALLRLAVNAGLKRSGVQLALAPTGKVYGSGLRFSYAVDSLLGAMWLQLALAIDGNRDYRTCAGCGDPWDATGARKSRDWCSERCRQRIYRRRLEEQKAAQAGARS